MSRLQTSIERLRHIMARLRDPVSGCPWDVEQSMQSLVRHTLEEAYEVADAIYREDPRHICEELGDLLFQIVFYAQIAAEEGLFDFDDVATAICDKLVRRHPHVFAANKDQLTADEVALQWQQIKAQEKIEANATNSTDSILDELPNGKPSIMRANDIQKACANVGFDWSNVAPVLDKVKEEIGELEEEINKGTAAKNKQQEEFGDLMFAMINLSRHLNIDPEIALQQANVKFERRFREVELLANKGGNEIEALSLEALELLWQQVKKAE